MSVLLAIGYIVSVLLAYIVSVLLEYIVSVLLGYIVILSRSSFRWNPPPQILISPLQIRQLYRINISYEFRVQSKGTRANLLLFTEKEIVNFVWKMAEDQLQINSPQNYFQYTALLCLPSCSRWQHQS